MTGRFEPGGDRKSTSHNATLIRAELAQHGENQHGTGVRDTKSTDRKDDAQYVLARLSRGGKRGGFGLLSLLFSSPKKARGIARNCPNRPSSASRLGFGGAVLGAVLAPFGPSTPTRGAVSTFGGGFGAFWGAVS